MKCSSAILVSIAALLWGCATPDKSNSMEYPISPRLATSYAGGVMTITWKAEVGKTYTVYYSDAPRGTKPNWAPLPQGQHIRGTGEQVAVKDTPKNGEQRRYLLLSDDQQFQAGKPAQ